ncbi:hypothetical protein T439DRAFT_359534 [Meredithblackwellia eburnea MCA 4105]
MRTSSALVRLVPFAAVALAATSTSGQGSGDTSSAQGDSSSSTQGSVSLPSSPWFLGTPVGATACDTQEGPLFTWIVPAQSTGARPLVNATFVDAQGDETTTQVDVSLKSVSFVSNTTQQSGQYMFTSTFGNAQLVAGTSVVLSLTDNPNFESSNFTILPCSSSTGSTPPGSS